GVAQPERLHGCNRDAGHPPTHRRSIDHPSGRSRRGRSGVARRIDRADADRRVEITARTHTRQASPGSPPRYAPGVVSGTLAYAWAGFLVSSVTPAPWRRPSSDTVQTMASGVARAPMPMKAHGPS